MGWILPRHAQSDRAASRVRAAAPSRVIYGSSHGWPYAGRRSGIEPFHASWSNRFRGRFQHRFSGGIARGAFRRRRCRPCAARSRRRRGARQPRRLRADRRARRARSVFTSRAARSRIFTFVRSTPCFRRARRRRCRRCRRRRAPPARKPRLADVVPGGRGADSHVADGSACRSRIQSARPRHRCWSAGRRAAACRHSPCCLHRLPVRSFPATAMPGRRSSLITA